MGNGCSSNSLSGATNDAVQPENRRTLTHSSTSEAPEILEDVVPLSTQCAALSGTNASSFCMKHNSVNDSAPSVSWEPRSTETTFAREDPGLASFEGHIDMSPLTTIIPPALSIQHAVTEEDIAPTTATNCSNAASPKTLHSPRIKHGPPKSLVVISAASAFHSVMPLFVDVTHHRHDLLEPVEVVELHLLGEGGSRGERRSGASSPSCSPKTPFQRRRMEAAMNGGGGDPLDSSGNSLGQVIQSMDVSQEMLHIPRCF
ncbi:Hypothetical protein, putative [Bodo saltans]|uniref:Uncharacterized protein n=1 Tax=Bodo saltans TaxID=75058 RepID=A0A0S4KJ13_BODSA|nr:Hypothetical protein, putative [Bodo saltans]|eukprot:CUI14966.1 Hypothetical protein, putative [Bodo saltans]